MNMTTTKKRFLHTGWLAALLAFALAVPTLQAAAESNFQIGVGANYWVALEDAVDESFDEDGLGWMISSRYMFTPYFGLGLELERSPDNYIALEEPIYCPALYLILGKEIYAGVGVGTYFYDGDFIEDAFYALRAGLALEMLPSLVVDINCNYRVDKWSGIKSVADDIDTDNVIIGAAVRIKF
jgi:hypothetical protein